MLPAPERLRRIAIVGGGLFPRTALVLRNLVPDADVVVIDANATNLNTARRFLDSREATFRPPVEFRHETFDPHCAAGDFDLVIVPLAFVGNRDELYRHPPAPLVLIHDWCWRRIGAEGARVSFLLLKRINLVRQ